MTATVVLANGFRVALDPVPGAATASLSLVVGAGSRHEAPGHGGIAHFVEHALFKGSGRRDVHDMARAAATLGTAIEATTGRETTEFEVSCLAGAVEAAAALLAEVVVDPAFPEDEIERERTVILQELDLLEDNPEEMAWDAALGVALPGQALGRPTIGTAKSVAAISREDLAGWWAAGYQPDRMVFAASGGFDSDRLLALAERLFGGLSGSWSLPEMPFRWNGGERRIDRDAGQIDLVLALPVPGAADPAMPAVEVLAEILGGGATSNRLFSELRERRGLCYGVDASLERARDGGLLAVSVTVAPAAVNKLLAAACAELVRLACEPPGADEVARAVAFLRTSEALSLESSSSRAIARALDALSGTDVPPGRWDRVGPDDVRAAAAAALANPHALAAIGPVGRIMPKGQIAAALRGGSPP